MRQAHGLYTNAIGDCPRFAWRRMAVAIFRKIFGADTA